MGRLKNLKISRKNLKFCKKIQVILFCIQFLIISTLIYFKCNYVINVTPSLPRGIYRLEKPENLKQGDIVLFDIDEDIKEMMAERKYIPNKKTKLLKTIGAFENNKIQIIDEVLYIDMKNHAQKIAADYEKEAKSNQTIVQNSTAVLLLNLSAENPPHRQAENR